VRPRPTGRSGADLELRTEARPAGGAIGVTANHWLPAMGASGHSTHRGAGAAAAATACRSAARAGNPARSAPASARSSGTGPPGPSCCCQASKDWRSGSSSPAVAAHVKKQWRVLSALHGVSAQAWALQPLTGSRGLGLRWRPSTGGFVVPAGVLVASPLIEQGIQS